VRNVILAVEEANSRACTIVCAGAVPFSGLTIREVAGVDDCGEEIAAAVARFARSVNAAG
jgi:hypothetical protein